MPLLSLILTLAVIGLVLWLVTTYIPMPAPVKTIIIAIVVIVFCVWLLQNFTGLGSVTVPTHR